MAHIRTQIRNKIKDFLTGIQFDGNDVKIFVDNPSNIQPSNFPCISIYSSDQNNNITTLGSFNRLLDVLYTINISIIVMSNTNLQDKVDMISTDVEKALSLDKNKLTLDGIVKDTKIVRVDFEFEEIQQKQIGIAHYVYEFRYMQKQNDPEISY